MVVGMWIVVSATMWPSIAAMRRIENAAALTQGVVVKFEPSDHQRATFRYTVDGKEYEGSELGCTATVGQRVRVYYLPEDPAVSSLSSQRGAFRRNVLGIIVVYAFFLAGGIIMYLRASRRLQLVPERVDFVTPPHRRKIHQRCGSEHSWRSSSADTCSPSPPHGRACPRTSP
jgi:hypothetical protein